MNAKQITIILGTRPEGIKLAPLIKMMQNSCDFNVRVCVTGQHRQMLDQVLNTFGIVPECNFNIMTENQDLSSLTCKLVDKITCDLKDHRPDMVIVQGDTTTVMAGGLASFYMRVPISHVEAGLRSNDIYSPFPEEANRRIVSLFAKLNFAPTVAAKNNLLKEGVATDKIYVTGNTGIDTLFLAIQKIKKEKIAIDSLPIENNRKMVLITAHRRESFGEGFRNICKAIRFLCDKFPQMDFVYPVHLNPNVQQPVNEFLRHEQPSNLYLIAPQDYIPFVSLLNRAYLILTDSGGVQEEAPSLGKPVLVMRDNTERPEAVNAGTARLVGNSFDGIVCHVSELLENSNIYCSMANATNPYGDGQACQRICNIIRDYFSLL